MTDAYAGTPDSTWPRAVPPLKPPLNPPPSSLCPVCGHVEARSAEYQWYGKHLMLYACASGHEWVTRWAVAPQ